MLIINADDWGGWREATDAAWECVQKGRVTAVSAMVFMEDSERAAKLSLKERMDVGLHINLTQTFTGPNCPSELARHLERTRRFLKSSRYALLIFHPFLRNSFRYLYEVQAAEFERLYGCRPTHIDGHQHMHLCTNMLLAGVIAKGERVRRSFSFWPGEKSWLNRAYRGAVDTWLARRYRLTGYFFSLELCLRQGTVGRVVGLANRTMVELMTHPEKPDEFAYLQSDGYRQAVRSIRSHRAVSCQAD